MTPLFKKLNFKTHKHIVVVNAPDSFKDEMKAMAAVTDVKDKVPSGEIEFFMAFVTKQKEVDDLSGKIAPRLSADGCFWFVYPKGTSKKYTCEFNRDSGWAAMGEAGFEPVRMVAVDEDWSALRFRRVENIKKMTRSFAITTKGKERTAGKTAAKKK